MTLASAQWPKEETVEAIRHRKCKPAVSISGYHYSVISGVKLLSA
jgi:hypothetical protein